MSILGIAPTVGVVILSLCGFIYLSDGGAQLRVLTLGNHHHYGFTCALRKRTQTFGHLSQRIVQMPLLASA